MEGSVKYGKKEKEGKREGPSEARTYPLKIKENAVIDAFDFARRGKEAAGRVPFSRFQRAIEGLPLPMQDETGDVCWAVQGAQNPQGELFLHLQVQASPTLVCQRCLEPFLYPLEVRVTLQLMPSAADVDHDFVSKRPDSAQEDTEAWVENVGIEKVLGSHRFNLLAQIEDELVLNLPYVPKHDICPGVRLASPSSSSPFAGLEKLKAASKLKQ